MGQLQQTSTFNGESFTVLPIPAKRQEGVNPHRTLYINESKNKVVVVSDAGDVITSISAEDGSELKIENI
jgi:hypothetical protein